MTQRFYRTLIVSLFIIFIVNGVMAQECNLGVEVYSIGGFSIAGTKTQILASNRMTEFSQQLGEKEVVNKIARFIATENPRPRGSESPRALAQNIYDVSRSYGIDPIIYAAKIRQESGQFNVDVVAPSGDTGLSQMTGNGLNEVYEQYKKVRSKNKSERQVGNVLAKLSENYFGSAKATNEWVNWNISRSVPQKKATLVRSVDYALASGASLFKIYLAVRNGNYRSAINQYNGGGTKNYYGLVDRHANVLRQISNTCGLNQVETEALTIMCEIVDSNAGCESIAKEIIPANVEQYDI